MRGVDALGSVTDHGSTGLGYQQRDRPPPVATPRRLAGLTNDRHRVPLREGARLVVTGEPPRKADGECVAGAREVRRAQTEHTLGKRALRAAELDEAPHPAEDETALAGTAHQLPVLALESACPRDRALRPPLFERPLPTRKERPGR